jgi:hypothetical protein
VAEEGRGRGDGEKLSGKIGGELAETARREILLEIWDRLERASRYELSMLI